MILRNSPSTPEIGEPITRIVRDLVALPAGPRGAAVVGLERDARGCGRVHDPREPVAARGAPGAERLQRHRDRRRLRRLRRAGPGRAALHAGPLLGARRRKFVEAEPHYPGPCGEMLDLIGQLYAVERGVSRVASRRARRRARRRGGCAPRPGGSSRSRSSTRSTPGRSGNARYPRAVSARPSRTCWGSGPGLTRFLDDARIPLDNNATERGAARDGEPGFIVHLLRKCPES